MYTILLPYHYLYSGQYTIIVNVFISLTKYCLNNNNFYNYRCRARAMHNTNSLHIKFTVNLLTIPYIHLIIHVSIIVATVSIHCEG